MSTEVNGWIQDPDSTLDYTFDWSEWLDEGDKLVSHVLEITPSNHTSNLVANQEMLGDKHVTVWLSGGRKNTKYKVTCKVTTLEGRTKSASIWIWSLNK